MSAVVLAALVLQVVQFFRRLAHLKTERSAVVTQIIAWGIGIAAIALASHASVTSAMVLPGTKTALGDFDGSSVVLIGLSIASLASSGNDARKAVDNSDTSKVPPLIDP